MRVGAARVCVWVLSRVRVPAVTNMAVHESDAASQKHISLESCQITAMKMMLLFQVRQLLSVLSAVNWRN